MTARIAALYRHPVKGFTPEALEAAVLEADGWFPGDRMWAVENGVSGFDPADPAHLPKQKFTVLMRQAILARVKTRWVETANVLHTEIDGETLGVRMDEPGDRAVFCDRLAAFLGEEARGPLRLIDAGPRHRFMDSMRGRVSVLNLASVRDLAERLGRPVDPLRFRANVWVEGWEPWVENGWGRPDAETAGPVLRLGDVTLRGDKPIVRCAATEVDPATGVRDMAVVKSLHDLYGHVLTGLYCSIETGGRIAVGDPVISPA
ncbi:MOSC domain-containing protein [Brevundimonas sp.]|uniref:MOSC domain-containing protein n=1 Tax=Brevundimonas sp. TaxID=1871086 RepID=UPI001A2D1EA3|nr:MOSC domain-containing protein [Brevundimonas sp.]MBJ7484555.1 MOSC domain-containing protein [Brevundimonas sp.]